MLTLYHAPRSRSSRIIWLLEELGADYKIAYSNISRMDKSGGADPANPHPYKQVPAIVHDGALVAESAAVVLYLTDLYPQAGIAPKVGDRDRGPYLSWLAYYAGVIEPVIAINFAGLGNNEALTHTFRGRAEMDRRILEGLGNKPFLLGEKFSAADLLIASMGQWSRDMLPAGSVIDAYLQRCTSRPAVKAAMAKDSPPGG